MSRPSDTEHLSERQQVLRRLEASRDWKTDSEQVEVHRGTFGLDSDSGECRLSF